MEMGISIKVMLRSSFWYKIAVRLPVVRLCWSRPAIGFAKHLCSRMFLMSGMMFQAVMLRGDDVKGQRKYDA
jgi:hypothetical protein